jgi:hypothetical protein
MVNTGCKKFVQVDTPYTLLATPAVFNDPTSATAATVGVYIKLSAYTPFNVARRTGAYSDELTNYSTGVAFSQACYTNALTPGLNIQSWTEFYTLVYAANSVIDGLNNSTALSDALKGQLMGEAKFSRAFFYFYLTNLFGDVPMPLGINYQQNALLPRTAQSDVYAQIISDLKDAESLLNVNFVDNTSLATSADRIRPTKWAARALLARAYLYTGDYVNAEAMASLVIGNTSLFSLRTDLNTVFSKNNTEAIWQVENVSAGSVQYQGYNFIISFLNTIGESNSAAISSQLLSAFETGDTRKTKWLATYTSGSTTYYYPFKYQQGYTTTPTQNETALRLAEQYLIRAEARAQQGNTTGAIADINVIRNRAGLGNYSGATDKNSLLAAVLQERRVELFAEWGHRWFDLKHFGTVNTVMGVVTPVKGGTWSAYKQLWPVPLAEINKDPNLTQNPGY